MGHLNAHDVFGAGEWRHSEEQGEIFGGLSSCGDETVLKNLGGSYKLSGEGFGLITVENPLNVIEKNKDDDDDDDDGLRDVLESQINLNCCMTCPEVLGQFFSHSSLPSSSVPFLQSDGRCTQIF